MSQFIRLAVPRRQKAPTNSIVINATPTPFTCETSGLYIKPIRGHHQATEKSLYYNAESGEVYYADTSGDFTIDSYWERDGQFLTPSGSFVGLDLNDALVVGGDPYGAGNVFEVSFLNQGNHFAFSNTADDGSGGYMINDQPVADRSKYLQITTNNTNILSVSGRVYELEHHHGGEDHVHQYWKEYDTAGTTLTTSGEYTALLLGQTRIDGTGGGATLEFSGYTAPGVDAGGVFKLKHDNFDNVWHFGYGQQPDPDKPAYMINGNVVADLSSYTQVHLNEVQIDINTTKITDISNHINGIPRGGSHWRNVDPGHDGPVLEPSSNSVTTITTNNAANVHWGIQTANHGGGGLEYGLVKLGSSHNRPHAQVEWQATVPRANPAATNAYNYWHIGVSGDYNNGVWTGAAVPGYFINDKLVADVSSYAKIGDNSGQISILINKVSDISTCCLDNTFNIVALISEVNDISNQVSDISTCCLDNSSNIYDLSSHVHSGGAGFWSKTGDQLRPANDASGIHTLEFPDGLFAAGATCTAIGASAGAGAHHGNVAIGYQCTCDGSGGGQVALGKGATTIGDYLSDASDGITLDYKPFVYADGSGTQFAFGYDLSGGVGYPALLYKLGSQPWLPLASTQVSISGDMDNMWTDLTGKIYPSANAHAVHTLELQKHTATSGTNGGRLIMGGDFEDYVGGNPSGRSAYMTIAPIGSGVGGMPSAAAAAAFPAGGTLVVEQKGQNGPCPSGTYFTFGGHGIPATPAIFINTDVVADASGYAKIGDNSGQISILINQVNDNSACCHDNSSNIYALISEVNDISNQVSDISGCCRDNSNAIFSLSGQVSDISGLIHTGNLAGEWTADGEKGIYYAVLGDASGVAIGRSSVQAGVRLEVKAHVDAGHSFTALHVDDGGDSAGLNTALEVDGVKVMMPTLAHVPEGGPTPSKMIYWEHGQLKVGDVSGSSAGGSGVGAGKGGRMLVLGPRCDASGSGANDLSGGSSVPWTTFSGPFANSLVDGNSGTSGYIDASANDPDTNNAQVIGNFPSWAELGGATQFKLTLIGAGGGGGYSGYDNAANRGGGGGAAEALIDCASESIYNYYFGDTSCALQLATRGKWTDEPLNPSNPQPPRFITSSSGASYLWCKDGSGTSTLEAPGSGWSHPLQGQRAWLFTQCGADVGNLQSLDGSGVGGAGLFDQNYAYSDLHTTKPVVRTYLGENQYSLNRFAMNGLGILDANNGARYGPAGIGNGHFDNGGGSALYIEWWPSSGGGSDPHAPGGGDDYFTLTKDLANSPSFPDSSLNHDVVNVFTGCNGDGGAGVGITFEPAPLLAATLSQDVSGYFTVENDGNYLMTLNLHLTAASGWLADTSCNVKIVEGARPGFAPLPFGVPPEQVLASLPVGMAGSVDISGGIEQTITCVKPLVNGNKITFWLENYQNHTNIIADVGTTANFARIGGGGGRGVMTQGQGTGSTIRANVTPLPNEAKGTHSVAIGFGCKAETPYSVALGNIADASNVDGGFLYRSFGGNTLEFGLSTTGAAELKINSKSYTTWLTHLDSSATELSHEMALKAPTEAPQFTATVPGQSGFPMLTGGLPPPGASIPEHTLATTTWCLANFSAGGGGGGGAHSRGMIRVDFVETYDDPPTNTKLLPDISRTILPLTTNQSGQHPVWARSGTNAAIDLQAGLIPPDAFVKITMVGGGGAGGGGSPAPPADPNAPLTGEQVGGGGGGGGGACVFYMNALHASQYTYYIGRGGRAQDAGWGNDEAPTSSDWDASGVPPEDVPGANVGGMGVATWCNHFPSWKAGGGGCGGPGGVDLAQTNNFVTRNGAGGKGGRVGPGTPPVETGDGQSIMVGSSCCGGNGSSAPRGVSQEVAGNGGWGGSSSGGFNCGGDGGVGGANGAQAAPGAGGFGGDPGCIIFEWSI